MPSLLVKNLLWRCSGTLQDRTPQFKRFSEHDMVVALNNGRKALHKFLPQAGIRTDAWKLAPGTRQSIAKILQASIIPGDGSSAADAYGLRFKDLPRNMGSNGTTPGRVITLCDRQRLDSLDPMRHDASKAAYVVRHYAYDPQDPMTVHVYPGVPSTGNAVWVDLTWVPVPVDLALPTGSSLYAYSGGSTTVVGIDSLYEDDLWNYVCAVMFAKDAKSVNALNRAAMHGQAFMGSINTQVELLTGHNPNLKQLPFAPDVPGAAS